MSKVHIIQHLCPQRHCIAATVFNDADTTEEKSLAGLAEQEKKLGLEPRCAICGSTDLFYETRPTKFATLDEAIPSLLVEQMKQLATRVMIDDERARKNN